MPDRFRGTSMDARLFRPFAVSRATPACRERVQHLSGVYGRRSSYGSPSAQRNQALRRHLFPRDRGDRARARSRGAIAMMGAIQKAVDALAQLSDAEWLELKHAEDRRRSDQRTIRDLSRELRDREPAR